MIFQPSARSRRREHPRLAEASTTVSDRLVGRAQSLLAHIRTRGARTSRNPNADVGRRSRTCCELSAATERRINVRAALRRPPPHARFAALPAVAVRRRSACAQKLANEQVAL